MTFFKKFVPFLKFADAQSQPKEDKNRNEHKVIYLTKAEFLSPIVDDYVRHLSELPPEEIYDNYNPGPTKSDGSVNFECHCVSHLVASPCGYAFRKAITCQKSASDEELEKGACADEFMELMECAMRTQCFRRKGNVEEEQMKTEDERIQPN